MEKIRVSAEFPVSPAIIYKAWLSSKEHSLFTGGKAKISAKEGGKFSAWDGYITGKTIKLILNKKILQTWRSSDFAETDQDSLLEIIFLKTKIGTKLTLIHSNIPDGQGKSYRQGWKDYYFMPMKKYFGYSSV